MLSRVLSPNSLLVVLQFLGVCCCFSSFVFGVLLMFIFSFLMFVDGFLECLSGVSLT